MDPTLSTTEADVSAGAVTRPSKQEAVSLPLVWRIAVEILSGTIAFILIAAAASLLSLFVDRLSRSGVSDYVLIGLRGAEMLIFAADILLFTAFIGLQTYRLIRKMLSETEG